MLSTDRYTYKRVISSDVVASGEGVLHAIVPTNTTGSITIYDNTSVDANSILYGPTTFVAGNPYTILLDCKFKTGLYVSTANGLGPVTIIYK